jgi:thiosulfate dehydrogenase [quinone] large subunit
MGGEEARTGRGLSGGRHHFRWRLLNMRADSPSFINLRRLTSLYLRLALGVAFLSAVADRIGIWGPHGSHNVAWGNFTRFTQYTAQVNPWAPPVLVTILAWAATVAETILGAALLAGIYTQLAGLTSGVLLSLFAIGMTIGTGVKSALDASVFSAAAGSFGLALLGPDPWSVDALRAISGRSDGAA